MLGGRVQHNLIAEGFRGALRSIYITPLGHATSYHKLKDGGSALRMLLLHLQVAILKPELRDSRNYVTFVLIKLAIVLPELRERTSRPSFVKRCDF